AFSVNFLEQEGTVGGSLSVRGRLADLIVTASFPLGHKHLNGGVPPLLEVALRGTGRPLLLSPQKTVETFGNKIAIAWNGTVEAARAVGLSMDFLRAAKEVVVISVNEAGSIEPSGDSLAEYLGWHGVYPQTVTLDGNAASSGAIVLQQVEKSGADMLVMGAYTRDHFRRLICGDVTGKVLAEIPVPVLMVN
ncbi:MAG: universal stress protein, partial [Halieaceae bacterium]|nr:universal stress protein [Halieaceae bacterium]